MIEHPAPAGIFLAEVRLLMIVAPAAARERRPS